MSRVVMGAPQLSEKELEKTLLGLWATGNYRCPKCCLPSKECKCFTHKGIRRCDICNGTFEVGEHYYSDCPASFVHTKCRFSKETT